MGATFARGVAFLSRGEGRGGQLRGIQSVPHTPVKGRGQARGGVSPVTWISSEVGARISSCRRPRRSVWSTPHREGTLRTQRRCTFISQPGGTELRVALQVPPLTPDSIPPIYWKPRHCTFAGAPEAPSSGGRSKRRLTGALHALVHQPVKEGATVVAEGGAAVAVQTELVLVPGILGAGRSRSEGVCRAS